MPRKSRDALLSVVPVSGQRMPPPEHLTAEQKAEWQAIVDSLPADYFRPGDVPLLSAFCVASALYKEAAARIQGEGMVLLDSKGRQYAHPVCTVLTTQSSAMAQMAVKLRLCPSARYSEKQAATKTSKGSTTARPWEFDAAEN